jgi:hypothetical protein
MEAHIYKTRIPHETANFRNPPIHSFTGDGRKLTDLQITKIKHGMYLGKYKNTPF